MKRPVIILAVTAIMLSLIVVPTVSAKQDNCVYIKDGTLTYSAGHYLAGEPLVLGYDPYGYNYNSHMFRGSYANAYLGRYGYPPYEGDDEAYLAENPGAEFTWVWPYRNTMLSMQWNDAWLANSDCDGDGVLDRYYGFPSYIGSGAWLTNHMWETYEDGGKTCSYNYFVKIVAVPSDAYVVSGIWYAADGTEIGSVIWGSFAIIQQVENDPCAGLHGSQYVSPDHAGFGNW
jgi:hypothetical protein